MKGTKSSSKVNKENKMQIESAQLITSDMKEDPIQPLAPTSTLRMQKLMSEMFKPKPVEEKFEFEKPAIPAKKLSLDFST